MWATSRLLPEHGPVGWGKWRRLQWGTRGLSRPTESGNGRTLCLPGLGLQCTSGPRNSKLLSYSRPRWTLVCSQVIHRTCWIIQCQYGVKFGKLIRICLRYISSYQLLPRSCLRFRWTTSFAELADANGARQYLMDGIRATSAVALARRMSRGSMISCTYAKGRKASTFRQRGHDQVIPKPRGGLRPIALFKALFRLWGKARTRMLARWAMSLCSATFTMPPHKAYHRRIVQKIGPKPHCPIKAGTDR
jgi:hypothetical protein